MNIKTDDVPDNYNLTFGKLKSYLSNWCETVELREKNESEKDFETVKLVRVSDSEVLFSKTYSLGESFSDDSLVCTSDITDKKLSTAISQIAGFNAALEDFPVPKNITLFVKA